MKNKEYYSIKKMLEYIDKVEKYTNELSFEKFESNDMVIDATIFAISQIGELVKNISKEFQKEHSTIKWSILKGLRNRIVHDYEGINLKLILTIVKVDIPKLKQDLLNIYRQSGNDE